MPGHLRPGPDDGRSILREPCPLVPWLYSRGGADQVTLDGDAALTAQLRRLLTAVMNAG